MKTFNRTIFVFVLLLCAAATLAEPASAQRKRFAIFISLYPSMQPTVDAWLADKVVDGAFHLDMQQSRVLNVLRDASQNNRFDRGTLDQVFQAGTTTAMEFGQKIRPFVPYLPETDIIIVGHSYSGVLG